MVGSSLMLISGSYVSKKWTVTSCAGFEEDYVRIAAGLETRNSYRDPNLNYTEHVRDWLDAGKLAEAEITIDDITTVQTKIENKETTGLSIAQSKRN